MRDRRPGRPVGALTRALAAAGFYAAAATAVAWPVAARPNEVVLGWVGDNYYFVWVIGWFRQALAAGHSPLAVPHLNYPEGWLLAFNEVTPAQVLLALPAALGGGPVLGYNAALLFSFVGSGLGTYLWVRRLTGSGLAGLLAGTIFAFAPFRLTHVLGHLNLIGTQWLPLYFWALDAVLRGGGWRAVAGAAAALTLIGLTSQYYLYMALVLSVAWVLLTGVASWRRLASVGGLAMPGLGLALWPYLELARGGYASRRTLEQVREWSASPTDFLLPPAHHFLWGEWVRANFDRMLWVENTLYLGVVALGLALFVRGPAARPLAGGAVVAVVLALGVELHWQGEGTGVPMPGRLLFEYLPFYSGMRVWMRYGAFVALFVAVLAGIGAARLLAGTGERWRGATAALLVAAALFEVWPRYDDLSVVQARAVDRWLAVQPGSGGVAELPVGRMRSPEHTYYSATHGRPALGFFSPFPTRQWLRVQPALIGFPGPESPLLLRELGVRYVVVDRAELRFALVPGIREATELDGYTVYVVDP